jgi:ABC-type antimicrobial peptide transport system permease subunit
VRLATLRRRSLAHFWRTNLAVVLGVMTAVAVLAGSLLVGESVRASLARLARARLGRTDFAVESSRFFRQDLATDIRTTGAFGDGLDAAAPLLSLPGVVTNVERGRQSTDVLVYGVDERFFSFHGLPTPPGLSGRSALLSDALAEDLQADEGAGLVVRLTPPSEIPGSTLFGRRDEPGRSLRVRMAGRLPSASMGDFALKPRQQEVRAAFLPLPALERALDLEGRANTLIVAGMEPHGEGALVAALGESLVLEDLGLRLRSLPARGELALESTSALLDDALVAAARQEAVAQDLEVLPVFIYLANAIRSNGREVPYSLVAALDDTGAARLPGSVGLSASAGGPPPLVLNAWAASDLGAKPGDRVTLEYYLWREEGRLLTESSEFTLQGVVPLEGAAADRDLVPEYPGITESVHLSDWDPPFPVDLKRIRRKDEDYWDRWRTTPKAFLGLDEAQRLFGHRLGKVTSLRLVPAQGRDLDAVRARFAESLRRRLGSDSAILRERGLAISPVRAQALQAARGTTDFGEYFVYFSFFLVAAALLLAGLFFRLGIEQRLKEIGLLRALGFTPRQLSRQFLGEGLSVATLGSLLGMAVAVGYAAAILWALRTVWVGAVGTRALSLHVGFVPLGAGAVGGLLAAGVAIGWTLRGLQTRSPRALLAGALADWTPPPRRGPGAVPWLLSSLATLLLLGSWRSFVPATGAFFGAGGLLLAAALVAIRQRLASRPRAALAIKSVGGLGLRGATFRPGRSVLCVALVASASFVIVSVGAFRRTGDEDLRARGSEAGGFTLLATSLQPLHHDPATPEGRRALGLPEGEPLAGMTLRRFRMSAGEDGSCLNLYRPTRPTVLGASGAFLRDGRFAFQSSLAGTREERANPWLILERAEADGVLPVAADANSLAYVLHKRLGEEMALGDTGVRVRFVAALRPGLFQSELVTGELPFQRAFPNADGYRFFLLEVPPGREAAVTEALESRLSDYGFDVSETSARLAAFHRVENTYITTFQTLGSLGLLLGTLGLATVLLRNALERRRELALVQAVGFARRHLRRMVLAENALLLGAGLSTGVGAALLAILPPLLARGATAPLLTVLGLVLAVSVTGILVSWLAVAVIARLPLLSSLRSE